MARVRPAHTYRIDPYDLRLFAAIVEGGSITAGAREIHLSLAAASSRLQGLEHAIGAPLLHRSKKGVTLTDAGRTMLQHAGRLQRGMEALHADMAGHAHGVRSTVRLLCNTAALAEHLPRLIGPFLAEHQDLDLDLRELDSQDVLAAMRQERADIGIVADYVDTQGLLTRPFRDDPLVALVPDTGSRMPRGKIEFADLLKQSFVGLSADSALSRFLQKQALNHGRGLHHRARVRTLDAVVDLVGEGVGVAVVPRVTAVRLASEKVAVRDLSAVWAKRRLLLCTAGEVPAGSGADALLRYLADPKNRGTD